jgi:hypothetical protein
MLGRQTKQTIVLVVGAVAVAAIATIGCSSSTSGVPVSDGLLALGNWGGDSGAMIVSDTAMHLHIGCTFGDVSGRIAVSQDGSVDVNGSYMLHVYPITFGPSVPAKFIGTLNGTTLTVTAIITDTTRGTTVTRGPVKVTLGANPRLLPCPVCRRPIITKRPGPQAH